MHMLDILTPNFHRIRHSSVLTLVRVPQQLEHVQINQNISTTYVSGPSLVRHSSGIRQKYAAVLFLPDDGAKMHQFNVD